jgi:hypothetical protein
MAGRAVAPWERRFSAFSHLGRGGIVATTCIQNFWVSFSLSKLKNGFSLSILSGFGRALARNRHAARSLTSVPSLGPGL